MLQPKFPLLPILAAHIPFEIAIGLNGRVWFKTPSISEAIAFKRVLEDVNEGKVDPGDKQAVERTLKSYLA